MKIFSIISNKVNTFFYNPFKKMGLSYLKYIKLKHESYNSKGFLKLNELNINYNHPIELIHSLKEIFIDQVYKIDGLRKDALIIDCGSNIGLSVLYLKKQSPYSRIIAFEPDNTNFELLKQNTNHLSNIELNNLAIWKENTELTFNNEGTLGSSINQNASNSTIKVKTKRLKELLNQKVDFLKIDIEGAEFEVLKDCEEELKNVQNLFLEYHGTFKQNDELNYLFNLLTKNNFAYYIKEADNVYPNPFSIKNRKKLDIQLNIFAFKTQE